SSSGGNRPLAPLSPMGHVRRAGAVAMAIFTLYSILPIDPADAVGPTGMIHEGVNIAGAEFTRHVVPGTLGQHYIFPTDAEIDYFAEKGMESIRVPILWERLQPNANGDFDSGYVARVDNAV